MSRRTVLAGTAAAAVSGAAVTACDAMTGTAQGAPARRRPLPQHGATGHFEPKLAFHALARRYAP
ncbi:hypothetical protein GWI34_24570 [Actinomadura sp. DSM 109109]|nr:hypothetical protein [Actinomadura lepetitiana]